ncbi:MAG: hypothetical protein ABR905_20525 [Terracidiphilus sp.]|jgi:hypothetical protein
MRVLKRTLIAVALTWIYSVTLGFLFAIHWDRQFHFDALLIPAAYIAPTVFSTVIAALVAPIAYWSIGNGLTKHCIYGPILWILLAVYENTAPPVYNLGGVVVLAAAGLVVLRLISGRQVTGGPVIGGKEQP